MKIWYFCSLLFFIISLSILIEDRYEVTYESNENKTRNGTELFDFLFCVPLKEIEIYSNRSEIDLYELKNELYQYFDRSKSSIQNNFTQEYENLVLNGIKGNNYLITRDQFCFFKIKEDDIKHFEFHLKNILQNRRYFAFNWDTYYMVEIKNLGFPDKLIVLNREYPYSNCTEN